MIAIENEFTNEELDTLQAQWNQKEAPKFNPDIECYACCGKLTPGEYYFCRSCAEAKFGND